MQPLAMDNSELPLVRVSALLPPEGRFAATQYFWCWL